MKKKIFLSTILLVLISSIAKILSFAVRIYLGRTACIPAMNLSAAAMPTLVFLIALAQIGIPSALSKLIAQSMNPLNSILSALIISLINNVILIGLFMIFIPLLSEMMFHQSDNHALLQSMIYMIPMVTLSGICKAILQGFQHHEAACLSQIFEEIFRLVFLWIAFSFEIKDSLELARIAMLSVFVGECGSTLFMLIYIMLKKNPFKRRQHDLKLEHFIEILSLSIPMTGSRLIGSFTYFLEPILYFSFSKSAVFETTYGSFNGYVMPLITMSGFISVTLASALLPTFVYEKKHHHLERAKKIFYLISVICIVISMSCAFVTFFFSEQILFLFYHTKEGTHLLMSASLPFIFYSLQPVLSSILHALDQSKQALIDTIAGCVLRLGIILVCTPFIHEHSLLLAIILSMLLTTFMHAFRVHKGLKALNSFS